MQLLWLHFFVGKELNRVTEADAAPFQRPRRITDVIDVAND